MKQHIIIGISAAGIAAAKRLRKLAPENAIICIAAQKELPYNTCLLADFLSEGERPDGLTTQPESFFTENNIELHLDTRVTNIDQTRKVIQTQNGKQFSYDNVLIATGTTPRKLPLENNDAQNCFNFHTMADANALDTFIKEKTPQHAVVIGAGLSGIECADALCERGLSVTIIEQAPQLLPTLIDQQASKLIVQAISDHNGNVLTGIGVTKLHATKDNITHITLSNDDEVATDLVVTAIGATPSTQCVQNINDLCIEHGGIKVNKYLQSTVEDIYAAGDVATVFDQLSGTYKKSCTWPDAIKQGMMAAQAMAGQPKEYGGVSVVLSSNFFDIKFVSCGPVISTPATCKEYISRGTNYYHKYIRRENHLAGFLQVGELNNIGALRSRVTLKKELSEEEWEQL